MKGVRIYGPPPSEERERAALCSFNVKGVHPTDLSAFLDQQVGHTTFSFELDLILYFFFISMG